MSADDIVFEGDVAYREPRRATRPDLDRRYACIAYEVPGPDDLPIFLDRKPADAIERHALRDTSVELGGILLGKECIDEETGKPFVWITEAIEAKHYENTQASFTYTHDSWEEITRERDRLHPDLDIVGWYHTHPDFGIFLSSHDLFIHHNFFSQPLQVAYVVDPIRQTRGFFQWRDDRMDQVGGYHLSAERGDRLALARLVHDLEGLPGGEGVGGLSPRLEAELIAMLTRPQHTASMAQPPTSAAAFSLLGIVVGALGVAAWLWLQAMNQNLIEQNKQMKSLSDSIDRQVAASREGLDLERVRGKEAALEALLRDVRPGQSPESFTKSYTQAVQDRDEARAKLAAKLTAEDALQGRLLQVEKERKALVSERDASHDKYQKLLAETSKGEPTAKDKAAGKADSPGPLPLDKKYQYAWFAAVAGWVVAGLLGLGLLSTAYREPPPEPAQEPPHSIT